MLCAVYICTVDPSKQLYSTTTLLFFFPPTFHNLQFPLECSYKILGRKNSQNHVYNSFILYKEINFPLAKYWTMISTEVCRWGWESSS